jgi:xanthine dehydrogenase molybdenum-binding subunit
LDSITVQINLKLPFFLHGKNMAINNSSPENPTAPFRVIGTRPVRPDDTLKVTGQAIYGVDVQLPDMLYGAVLRSPHAHARILSIDTRQVLALEGVRAVITAADLPDLSEKIAETGEWEDSLRDQIDNILARDKVLYYGHAVAAVAAASAHIAAEALELIQVAYEVLPPVLEVQQAMAEGAPILHAGLRTDEEGVKGDRPTNIASHMQTLHGDPAKGFAQAKGIVEREFHTSAVHQGYLEPNNATALYAANGQITIWCSTQGSFSARDSTAEILQIPASRIRVIPQEIGGGFGGKNRVYLEPLAALLSQKSGHKPVKMVMHHHEVLAATGPAAASWIRVKMGAGHDGRITAATASIAFAAGAFPGSTVGVAMGTILGHYRIENLQIDGYDVVTNTSWSSSYRGLGATNAAFASESVVDELCEKLGMDPIEFRLINGVREGDPRSNGHPYARIGFLETLEAARAHPHYASPLAGPHQGRGVAAGYWGNAGGRSTASASINSDGSVNLVTGSVDLSGTRMTLAMQLAETLGISAEDVKASMGDTDSIGFTDGSWGSRTTFATGWAVYELGQNLIRLLCQRAADHWQVPADQVRFEGGVFTVGDQKLAFKKLAAQLNEHIPVMASAAVNPWSTGPAFATHIVDVEVDPETGGVKILRYTAVQDAGKAIHPAYVEGQMQGGTAQGIGWALNEEYIYDEAGRMLNASYLDYRIPTCSDLPPIDTVIVEVPNPGHPYGVRGVGEMSIVPPPAALANAIHAATGLRLSHLPMSPARILEAYDASE